ncbi:MAG: tRNA (uridine(34)/cytosine(34)/5-carboxymethylaminomethyluridine(34)-2'-O)-methyltransferase TrmL [Proteobacteria bacterium]|nr:tRNA (uridine(34)/cytosine(34)/5-carboxymethylaminomethyluridine(34)-2'-O)-methyltransferase TrmL [Pseudomonadota bacterium]
MFNIVLFEPEIPPNTGNIIRLCANTGCQLHLIEPLGFSLDEKSLRRAGLDYHEYANVRSYQDLAHFISENNSPILNAFSTKGIKSYSDKQYTKGDYLLFGPETRGLPQTLLDKLGSDHCLRLPMRDNSRSLNLSNTVSIVVYEAWRQNDFAGANSKA